MRKSSLWLALLIGAAPLVQSAEQVTISEFMASNTSGLRDEDGQLGDWIELYNSGTNAVSLDGWYLTDSASNLTKWRIPNTNINAGAFIIVFADGKNRAVPGATLHANFSLSASGEYLALVKPNGTTKATQFSPAFPAQAPNVSYGFGTITTNFTAIATNTALVRWRIPDGTEGPNWMGTNYDDSPWLAGTNGVGYGTTNGTVTDYSATVLPMSPVLYYRLDETSGTTAANLGSGGGSMNGSYTATTLGTAGPRPPTWNGFEANNNAPTFNGASGFVGGPVQLLSSKAAFTMAGWVNFAAAPIARAGLFGQNDTIEFGFSAVGNLQCFTAGGGTLNVTYNPPLNTWVHILVVGDGATLRIFINGVLAGSLTQATASYGSSAFNFNIGGGGVFDATGNFHSGLIDEVGVWHRALTTNEILALYQAGTNGFDASVSRFVRTDVGPVMSNITASAYIRIPFTVAEPTNVSGLTLRMRYDDGFVAFINGSEVVRANATDPLAFNSAATNAHSPLSIGEFRFGAGTLVAGTNILAIQGLNVASNDVDFLVSAELVTTSFGGQIPTPVYFTQPTPGAPNLGGIANPGPIVSNPSHSPNVPLDAQNVVVTTEVAPSFLPVASVVMRYRIMFDNEIEVAMFDDGAHGDGAAGDGVFGATIPESASTNGQMIRWYFRATDTGGNVSRYPVFASPADTAEYLGTIVNPTNLTSKLPIMHIFAGPGIVQPGPGATAQTLADGQTGGQVSFFYDGEFYDNIHMELRGNSTAGFNKKSHRLDFNREHAFRYSHDAARIRKTSFTADWPDSTYMRQQLSYWLATQLGAPAPFYYPVRLQLNGQFYQLANHNDVHGEEYLTRIGYDPNGALYNSAGQVTTNKASTGGFDKKTRTWDSDADYTNLVVRIEPTNANPARLTNAFDLFDVPEIIDYIVAARWSHEDDDVWANMSLYHDNDGDGLWRVFPFDMNLSWGAMFDEGFHNVQATNDTHKSHPLYGGNNIRAVSNTGFFNRMYDTFFSVPQLRQMVLRRMRTMLDTYIKPPGTPTNSTFLEQMILSNRDLIAEEARLDRIWWGWPAYGGQNNFDPPPNADPFGSAARTNAATLALTNGVNDLLNQFLYARRQHFYGRHSVTNTALTLYSESVNPASNTCAGIPLAQASNLVLRINQLEFNPSSGNQGHEFIQVTNPNSAAVDISGWKLDGGVDFTFKPGTVILPNGVIYVTPDLKAFRTRTVAPKTNQALFVVGNYQGTLDARGEIVRLLDDGGRVVHTNGYVGDPSLVQQYLRITEIMYHPGPTNVGSPYGQEEFEYLELKNIGPSSLSLLGVHFTNGVDFTFTTNSAVTNLAAGQLVVLVRNPAAFVYRYGSSATIAGTFTGSLDNSGERIKLDDVVGEQIMDFSYNNSWYPITDGLGFSLVIVNENAPFDTWSQKASWRPSGVVGGSAGTNDPAPLVFVPVLVNEVLANSDAPAVDAIELWNNTTNVANISHWWISDDFATPQKYRVPTNTMIPPGGYIVFTETNFNPGGLGFSFSAKGDEAYVFSGDAAGNLTGYYHGFGFDASETGVSFGRYVPSDGDEQFVAQETATLGAANSLPKVGPVVLSEIMYHPPDVLSGTNALDDSDNEFIELHNITGTAAPLFDPAFPTNRWTLTSAVDFTFGTNTIPAGGFLVVVSFDPATSAAKLASFRARYGIDTNVVIVGPYSGKLDNSDNSVKLRKPDRSDTNEVTHVLVEEVHYHDSAPWDFIADGFGASLQRIVVGDFGNDPTNFVAARTTPGSAFPGGARPVVTQQPASATVFAAGTSGSSTLYLFGTTNFTASVSGSGLTYQWSFNGSPIPGATNFILTLSNIQFSQAGSYNFLAYGSAGSVVSSNATLTVLTPVSFTLLPTNQNVQPGTSVTLASSASGTGTIHYQWRFEGTNIANATNASYSFLNAGLTNHGNFSVLASDDFSSTVSSNAFIYVLVKVGIVTHIQSNTVLQGGTAIFSVVATGAPPLWYRWIRGGAPFLTNTSPVLVLTNVQVGGSYRVGVTNAASPNGVFSPASGNVTLTVLADFDQDGIADIWEAAYFGNASTNDPSNALLDPDGDGMSNRDEYIAGTNPTNALSVLKIVLSATNTSQLEFLAQSNVTYSVQARADLATGVWTNLTNIGGQTGIRTIQVNTASGPPLPQSYYRIVTPLVP